MIAVAEQQFNSYTVAPARAPVVTEVRDLDSFAVAKSPPTPAVAKLADSHWKPIRNSPLFKGTGVHAYRKRMYWRRLVAALYRAWWAGGCVRIERASSKTPIIGLRVIECAAEAGLIREYRTPPGFGKRCTRLLPTELLNFHPTLDPADFDPPARLVEVRSRDGSRHRVPFDPTHPVAVLTEQRLRLINEVNSQCEITFERDCGPRRLNPAHYARFSADFNYGGRLYSLCCGHQSLRKTERQTIRFDGVPGVELDYGSMHPRMLYHLDGMDYDGDPYALWGEDTTPDQRRLAKLVMNVAINAGSRKATLLACHDKARKKTRKGRPKEGKQLEAARRLQDALRETGLTFQEVYDLAWEIHRPIAKYLSSDYGVTLMRHDSAIALEVLFHFAERGIPCLGVHDSFIVPLPHADELRRVMVAIYHQRFGFDPVVNPAFENEAAA